MQTVKLFFTSWLWWVLLSFMLICHAARTWLQWGLELWWQSTKRKGQTFCWFGVFWCWTDLDWLDRKTNLKTSSCALGNCDEQFIFFYLTFHLRLFVPFSLSLGLQLHISSPLESRLFPTVALTATANLVDTQPHGHFNSVCTVACLGGGG